MRSVRLSSKFWIDSYRELLNKNAIPLFIVSKGDDTAGAILIKVCDLKGGCKLFSEITGIDSCTSWSLLAEGSDEEMNKVASRQLITDPDLWLLEIEDREGRHFLEHSYLQRQIYK